MCVFERSGDPGVTVLDVGSANLIVADEDETLRADVEVIPIQKVNEAYERLLKSDVKYHFSIDMASLKSE